MKLRGLSLSRNRHLTIFEKNKINKVFDDKRKRMPESLFDELSDIEVLEIQESVGTTFIVLDIGQTTEQLEEDRRKARQAAKNAMRRIGMTSMLLLTMSSSLGGADMTKEAER